MANRTKQQSNQIYEGKRWWDRPPATVQCCQSNHKAILEFLDVNDVKGQRYHVQNIDHGSHHPYMSAKTIRRAIKNGHHHMQIWIYVNRMKSFARKTIGRNGDYYRTEWVSDGLTENFNIDFDELVGIKTLDQFEEVMTRRGVRPFMVCLTSSGHFHAVIMGKPGEWTFEKKISLVCKMVGIENPSTDQRVLHEALKRAGVDVNYLMQDPSKSKMRVPGSINYPKSENGMGIMVGAPVLVEGRQFGQHIQPVVPVKVIPAANSRPARRHGMLYKLLEPIVTPGTVDGWVEVLADGLGWLKEGRFRLRQETAAQMIGISQASVSRMLPRLVEEKILTIELNGVYVPNSRARTYGAGERLLEQLGNDEKTEWHQDAPYEDGMANEQAKRDIRHLVAKGWTISQVVEFCFSKEQGRQKRRRRYRSYFKATVKSWMNRIGNRGSRVVINRPIDSSRNHQGLLGYHLWPGRLDANQCPLRSIRGAEAGGEYPTDAGRASRYDDGDASPEKRSS